MIPQSMRLFLALMTIVLGLLVIANHWIELVTENSDLLTSHVLGFVCVLFGMNLLSESSESPDEAQARYQDDSQTKF